MASVLTRKALDFGQSHSLETIVLVLVAFALFIFIASETRVSHAELQVLNSKKLFEFTRSRAKKEFAFGARDMLRRWFETNPSTACYVNSDVGPVVVLPPHMANEIRNEPGLSFAKFVGKSFHSHLPGFEGFREGSSQSGSSLIQMVLTRDLTKQLAKVTEDIADETELSIQDLFTESKEWHDIPLQQTILRLVARISSRVFLGEELCRNEDWLRVTTEYTIVAFRAAENLRFWPSLARPIVHWFLLGCRQSRELVKEARRIIQPILEKRRELKSEARVAGQRPPEFNDAIEWFETTSNGRAYDPALVQLFMSVAAIHTTTDLICQTLIDLAQHPDIVEHLRREISTALEEEGWRKTSLYKMKLLDSVIKESQRLKPNAMASMRRIASNRITLSNGTIIEKGDTIAVSSHTMWDATLYPNPTEWDGYRFYKMRNTPGKQSLAQLVTTSPEHFGFGHGLHACPGRFFAANEVKIALVHVLMKYDLQLGGGVKPKVREFGFTLGVDPHLEMRIRRNGKELDVAMD
ncbi:Dihydromonacolin L monooxygenase LovA [Acrodontium crateriforme]|uniref:Dihydromonacolin L monooxygenase LovA n=1 Tax=Acrodontium crateriforme TaxID=150365 RepID=A0AAQ3M2P6_9PEZI|nr:Dihydromonacolin L monooxygenase LovA [Acrodontium crateriforme]